MPFNLNLLDNNHSNGPGTYSVMQRGVCVSLCVCVSELSNPFQINVKMCTQDVYIFNSFIYIVACVCVPLCVSVHCLFIMSVLSHCI